MIRFTIPVLPNDGSRQFFLVADLDRPLVPRVGDVVLIDTNYGVSAEVHTVAFAPTGDPTVYVTCRHAYPHTAAEADELAAVAVSHGWRRS